MSEDIKRSLEQIENLSDDARIRVNSALKAAIERETVTGGLGNVAAGNIFSRGWIFSRLTPTQVDLGLIRELPGVSDMNPDQFADFAGRLAELKRKTDRS